MNVGKEKQNESTLRLRKRNSSYKGKSKKSNLLRMICQQEEIPDRKLFSFVSKISIENVIYYFTIKIRNPLGYSFFHIEWDKSKTLQFIMVICIRRSHLLRLIYSSILIEKRRILFASEFSRSIRVNEILENWEFNE